MQNTIKLHPKEIRKELCRNEEATEIIKVQNIGSAFRGFHAEPAPQDLEGTWISIDPDGFGLDDGDEKDMAITLTVPPGAKYGAVKDFKLQVSAEAPKSNTSEENAASQDISAEVAIQIQVCVPWWVRYGWVIVVVAIIVLLLIIMWMAS